LSKPVSLLDKPDEQRKYRNKILLIGSSQYREKFEEVRRRLASEGNEVRTPAFDNLSNLDDYGVCLHNRSLMEWCDRVHIIWDCRSTGTIFDFGMAFALRKPITIEYLESKTWQGVMRKYEVNPR